MPIITIPPLLREQTANQNQITIAGESIQTTLKNLVTIHPGMEKFLFQAGGEINTFLAIFCNGQLLRSQKDFDKKLLPDDNIEILLSLAGG